MIFLCRHARRIGNIGWSTLTGRKMRNGKYQLSQADLDVIGRVITRAEAFEREEQRRLKYVITIIIIIF